MIEINFKAKGEKLEELLQHMKMVNDLMRLQETEEIIENRKGNGTTKTSNYEFSIKNTIPNYYKITGVAIRHNIGISSMEKGSHAELIKEIIKNGTYTGGKRIEGFILANGTFLNRFEARIYALKIGQINSTCIKNNIKELYSQDLW